MDTNTPDTRSLAPSVHVLGWSNTGKTQLVELLLPRLAARGLTAATVKHSHHGYDLDQPGTDTSRHLAAGASASAIVGPDGWAVQHQRPADGFDEVIASVSRPGVDLVLVEGFTSLARHAIELPGDRHAPEPGPGDQRLRLTTGPEQLDDAQLDELVTFCERLARS